MSTIEAMVIQPQEVLRYLGYRGQTPDEKTRSLVADCIAEAHTLVRPRTRHIVFPLSGPPLSLDGTAMSLPGQDIAAHLSGCGQCVLMAATLGIAVDHRLHVLQNSDIPRAVVMEAVASAYIEALCDRWERTLRQEIEGAELGLTRRFSPGYGDFPLSLQPRLLGLLDAGRKMGLYCNESHMMTPRKSVTAVLGILDTATRDEPGNTACKDCQQRGRCPYEKGGTP